MRLMNTRRLLFTIYIIDINNAYIVIMIYYMSIDESAEPSIS